MVQRAAIVICLVVAVVVTGFGEAKPGGVARQISMGGSQAGFQLVLNPFIMDDPTLMLLNPAYQTMYRDYAWMNIGGGSLNTPLPYTLTTFPDNGYGHQNAGVNFALSEEWGVGAVLSYDPSAINFLVTGLNAFGASIPPVGNMWEVVASHHSGAWSFGFGFMYGRSNSDTTQSTTAGSGSAEHSANVFGFRLGALYDMGSGDMLDLSAAVRLDKAEGNRSATVGTVTTSQSIEASATEFAFTARWKHKVNQKWSFIPVGALAIASTKPDTNGASSGAKISALVYSIGIGGEYRTSDFYLAGGLSYQSAQVKLEQGPATSRVRITSIPTVNVGGEWWFTEWLAGRVGYYRAMMNVNTKSESPGSTTETNFTFPNSFVAIGGLNPSNNDGLVTLGLGFRFGNFSLDATISEEALRRGLGLIGASDNINTFGYITSSYNFGD